jgi:hypothetical protein
MAVTAKQMKNLTHKGRVKGSKNKFTTLKQSFLDAFVGIGGTKELQAWGKKEENRTAFYSMITKMLPKNMEVGVTVDDILSILPADFAGPVREALIRHLSGK